MRRAIAVCGGAEVKTIGDAIMAQFDSAVSALDCAVLMQQANLRDNARSDLPIEMRVGVSMGEVAEVDGDVHGLPVVEASRLCAAADGGEVLVADVVRHLAGSRSTHTFVPRPALELKGFPDPVDACEVLWRDAEVAAVWLPRRLVDAARSSCVGRELELEVLQEAWASITPGRRRLALVSGEPGIGKTRLVAELASTAEDATIAYGWCDQDTSAAYFPWSTVVRSLTRSHPDVLAGVAPSLATEIHRLVPELGADDLPVVGDASITRLHLFDALDTFLGAVSARQSLLVVLDDLHWADAGTLAIIRHLLRSDRGEPLLIVGTYRDTDLDRTHPLASSLHDLLREPGTVRVSLSGLGRDSVGILIADRAGHPASKEFVDLIFDETEGNPYFTEEVLAHLAESGAMHEDAHGDWVNTVPVADVGVPEGIRDALGRRLSRLPVETNEVLAVAAVVGREFDVGVVGDVLSLSRLDIIERLEPALDAGLVLQRSGNSVGSFAHALVRESLLGELRSTRRTRLHWLVGRALASRAGVAPAVVAHHLCEGALAGDVGEAVSAALTAAAAADQLGAMEDAFAWSERAIEVLDDATEKYPELYNRALYNRGFAGLFSQSLDRVSGDLATATSLALDRSDHVLAVRALAQTIRRAGFIPAEVEALAARAVDETPPGSDLAAVARGLRAFLAATHGRPFDVADAEAAVDALDTAIPLELSWHIRDCFLDLLLGLPDIDRCRDVHLSTLALGERHKSPLMIGLATLGLGYMAARRADRTTMNTAAQRVRSTVRGGLWNVVHVFDISLALADGRLDDAELLIHDASALVGPETPLAYMFAYEAGVLDHLRGRHEITTDAPKHPHGAEYLSPKSELARQSARNGDWGTAIATLTTLMPHSLDELLTPLPIINVLAGLAEAAGIVRDADRAAMLIPALQPYADQMAIGHCACELKLPVSSLAGRLKALTGDPDGGVSDGEAGLELVQSLHTPLLEADTSIALADVLLLRGHENDVVRARALLTEAVSVSKSCGAYGVADMGQRLLDTASLP